MPPAIQFQAARLCLESNSEAGRIVALDSHMAIGLCLESNSEAGRMSESARLALNALCLESNSEAGRIRSLQGPSTEGLVN